MIRYICHSTLAISFALCSGSADVASSSEYRKRVDVVTNTQGLVAFWDFVKRELGGEGRFAAWVPPGSPHDYALDANNYVRDHGIYVPKNDGSGGPFTIGRVIHSARTVGFTGWIGGVAVFDRALGKEELERLSEIAKARPIAASEQ